jgi:hypothetical protein
MKKPDDKHKGLEEILTDISDESLLYSALVIKSRPGIFRTQEIGKEKQARGDDLKEANRNAFDDRKKLIREAFAYTYDLGERDWHVLVKATRGKLKRDSGMEVSSKTVGRYVVCPPDVKRIHRKKSSKP